MASSLVPVREALRAFLAGGPFMPFWRAVMDATEFVDSDSHLSDANRDWFDELYDLVYMSAEEPLDSASRDHGIRGATDLRDEIRTLGLDRFAERLPDER